MHKWLCAKNSHTADGSSPTSRRNMAAEYFDYNHEYNFRDRDALLLGAAAGEVRASFETFWASELAVPVEKLLGENPRLDDAETARIYRELHEYARSPDSPTTAAVSDSVVPPA